MTDSTPQFGRVPYAPIDARAVATMKPADAKVYVVLCAHVGSDWTANPGQRRIARLAGLTHGAVGKALARLAGIGLIEVARGCGRRSDNYRICALWGQGAIQGLRPAAANGCALPERTVAPYSGPASALSAQGATIEQKKKQQQNRGAGAPRPAAAVENGDKANPAVLAELDRLGIGSPTREELACITGITVSAIGEALQRGKADRDGAPAGVRIKAIREYISDAIDLINRRKRRIVEVAEKAGRDRAARITENQRNADEREEVDRLIAQATDNDLAAAKATVMCNQEEWLKSRWNEHNPRNGAP
ncbi:MAG: hypothetical protein HQ495_08705, partial [Alphaproteobacteria bacterium]|nr:hypothetical protein [Alphaproteobacteria bacterium]